MEELTQHVWSWSQIRRKSGLILPIKHEGTENSFGIER